MSTHEYDGIFVRKWCLVHWRRHAVCMTKISFYIIVLWQNDLETRIHVRNPQLRVMWFVSDRLKSARVLDGYLTGFFGWKMRRQTGRNSSCGLSFVMFKSRRVHLEVSDSWTHAGYCRVCFIKIKSIHRWMRSDEDKTKKHWISSGFDWGCDDGKSRRRKTSGGYRRRSFRFSLLAVLKAADDQFFLEGAS